MSLRRKTHSFSTLAQRLKLEHRGALLLLSTICATFFTIDVGFAAECLRDDRAVTFPDGSSRVRSYVCKLQNSATPQLRVEFHRLSEASAGSLLQNLHIPVVETVIGRPKLLKTDVGTEAKKIFDEFGSKQLVSSCLEYSVAAAKGGKDYTGKSDCTAQQTLAFFSIPGGGAWSIALPDDNTYIKSKAVWPPNYNFFYTSKFCNGQIQCTVLWRTASISDLNDYRRNLRRQNQIDNIPNSDVAVDDDEDNLLKYFKLVKYLMRSGWQNDFLTITGTYGECGGYNFIIYRRELILDVATIENISPAKLDVEGLIVSANTGTALRKAASLAADGGASAKTVASATALGPREKALVPLRMTWRVTKEFAEAFADRDTANRKYAQLQNTTPGTVFNIREDRKIVIRKTRESFGAPSVPAMDDFVYGPVLDLTGLLVRGETVSFAERSRNFLQATVINESGSCPFLYAWHPKTQSWIWYGKVIHKANSKAREMTQEIPLTGFATRFRLREEELELSHIDYAGLTLELEDGTSHVLKPDNPALSEVDGKYVQIPAGGSLEFEFNPPLEVTAAAVKRSALTIRGYYEPYLRLNIGQNSNTPPILPVKFRNR